MLRTIIENALTSENAQAVEAVVALFQSRAYEKGASLLHQGDSWDHAFVVEQGIVRMHLIGRDGKDFNKNFHGEGALICPLTKEMEKQPSLFAISALEKSVIWHAPMLGFRRILREYGLWEPLRGALLARLVNQKLQREHDLLTLDGTSRYRQLCRNHPELASRVPVAHLASYLGLTDVSLSRIRRQLKEEKA